MVALEAPLTTEWNNTLSGPDPRVITRHATDMAPVEEAVEALKARGKENRVSPDIVRLITRAIPSGRVSPPF